MPFNSLQYFLLLPMVYLAFYLASDRSRWCVLLAASLLFYAALGIPYLLVVLVLVTVITYGVGIWLDRADTTRARNLILSGGIAAVLLILIVLKYLPFLSEHLTSLLTLLPWEFQMHPAKALVAIGVSYYVFQAISYLIDIHLKVSNAERHFGYFALYLAFFPKLLQGPIERAGDLIPQLKAAYTFNYDNMRFGLVLFSWGLFKKVVIADRLALYVNPVYGDVGAFSGFPLLLATYLYAFQIYLDFSGYTDMAMGTARLFNIHLSQNFNSPYLAVSIADFWRRWHITFSRWILGYIFAPLQMQWRYWKNRGTVAALLVAFLISGAWHGASWGYVIWGGLHGLYMACSVVYRPYQKKLHKALGIEKTWLLRVWQTLVTFNLVSLSWVFFRADTVKDAGAVLTRIFAPSTGFDKLVLINGSAETLILVLVLLVYCLIACASCYAKAHQYLLGNLYSRWACYVTLVFLILLFWIDSRTFVYFQF